MAFAPPAKKKKRKKGRELDSDEVRVGMNGGKRSPGGRADDVVHAQDHLGGLRGREQHRPLELE